jgi:hypothetical protein
LQTTFEVGDGFWAWMPGTRPGKTCRVAKGGALQPNSFPRTAVREAGGVMRSMTPDECFAFALR